MKVKELIKILSTYNPNAKVNFRYNGLEFDDAYMEWVDVCDTTEINIDKYDSNEKEVILTNTNYSYTEKEE